jgi:hypothetical protein
MEKGRTEGHSSNMTVLNICHAADISGIYLYMAEVRSINEMANYTTVIHNFHPKGKKHNYKLTLRNIFTLYINTINIQVYTKFKMYPKKNRK